MNNIINETYLRIPEHLKYGYSNNAASTTGWGIKISHFSKRYKIWKKPSRKKIEYISEKYIKKFFNGF